MRLIYVIFAIFFAYEIGIASIVLLMGHILITSFSMLGYPAFFTVALRVNNIYRKVVITSG